MCKPATHEVLGSTGVALLSAARAFWTTAAGVGAIRDAQAPPPRDGEARPWLVVAD